MSEVHFGNIDSEMREGRVAQCRSFLEAVPQGERCSAEYLGALLRFYYRQSEFAQAVFVCEELFRLYPHDLIHRYVLFDCCSHLGWFERARAVADVMVAGSENPAKMLIQADFFHIFGLDNDAAQITEAFESQDHLATVTQSVVCQAIMRSQGIMRGIRGYARAWTNPHAMQVIYGRPALNDYWYGQQPLPERLEIAARGGVGDTFQWMRYLPILQAAGVEIKLTDERAAGIGFKPIAGNADIHWARPRLGELAMARSAGTMLTEPFALLTSLFPILGYADNPEGYLTTTADPVAEEQLREIRAKANGRPAVAVTWSSSESPWLFASKSLTIDQMAPLLEMQDIHWVVCQRGLQREAFLQTPQAELTTVLPTSFTFNQTGVVLEGLDAVVANCSSIVHLSAGLGCATFLLASAAADWRWESFPSSSPWYARTHIVRQPTLGDWDGAVTHLQSVLKAWMAGRIESSSP